jgi:hypothetical protein
MTSLAWAGFCLICLSVGFTWGSNATARQVTSHPDRRGVSGAHCIRGRFWYVVPESLWVKMSPHLLRDEGVIDALSDD